VATVEASDNNVKGHVAIWNGSKMPLSSELCHAVSARLQGVGEACAEMACVAPVLEIQRRWSRVPGDGELLVEFAVSREGEHLFVYPLAGRLVHEGLAALMAFRMSRENGETIHTTVNDYGFSLTARRGFSLDEGRIRSAWAVDGLLDDLVSCMNTAELAQRQFREVARVSGLIPQDPPGARARGQRDLMASSALLFEVLDRYDPGNLLLEQARREILERQLEMSRLLETLDALAERPLVMVETERLTPMAFPLWADRITALMPGGDAADRLAMMLEELQSAAR
jgi:ATP-dependent Lhr-like helicase